VINDATALDARAAAERIGTLLSHTPVALAGGRHIHVSLEAGVAEATAGDDAAALIRRAFERMEPIALRRAS
jgi:GGDEF domain-containing protein